MARSYHTEVIAFASGADAKWIDNLLSRFRIPGIVAGRQGVSRRASAQAVYHVALIRSLVEEGGIPTASAVRIAIELLSSERTGPSRLGAFAEITLDVGGLRAAVDRRLDEATESLVPARRGRPARRSA